jgi:predicted nucleic acid-binding protein
MALRFLDTNVLIRYLTGDDPQKAERAYTLLLSVERGGELVATSPMVIFETVFVLEKTYGTPRATIRERLQSVILSRGLRLANKTLYLSALDLYVQNNISFADAYNAAYMRSRRLEEIYTWDTDFDAIEGIARVEPGQ